MKNTKEIKLFFPILFSVIVFVITSLITYFSLISIAYKNEKFKLTVLRNNLIDLTKHELETAIYGEPKKFLLFSNYKQELNSSKNHQEIIISDQNTLIVKSMKYKLTLDLQEFKEFVDQILPSHIIYKISLNKNIIAVKALKAEQYMYLTESTNIDHIVDFSLELGINKNSEYYQKILNKFYKRFFILSAFNAFLVIFCFICYLAIKNKFKQLKYKNQLLFQYIQVTKKLENLFTIPENNNETKTEEINISELANDLRYYFIHNEANIKIDVDIKAQNIFVPCSKKSFYQLIFSLTHLLIAFMNGQSKEQKSIIISLNKTQTTFRFESFVLDEKKMIYLADNVLSLPKSFFLLDCTSLFQFIKDHGFKYNIEILEGYNHRIEISVNKEKKIKNSKILKFRSSKDV